MLILSATKVEMWSRTTKKPNQKKQLNNLVLCVDKEARGEKQ